MNMIIKGNPNQVYSKLKKLERIYGKDEQMAVVIADSKLSFHPISTAQDFSHEAFHFAEGTKEYRAMYDFLRSIKLNGESLVDTAIDKVRNLGYEVDDTIYDKIKNRESLSGQDARQVELALSEINAKAAELLFGDAETIDKLVDRDRSLARKVLSNMRDYAKIIENVFKGEKDSVETLKQMRKGIKLFEDALAASGEDYLRGKSIERQQEIRKQNNNTDKNETIVSQKVATQSSLRIIDGEQVVVVDTDVVSASDTPKSILSILSNIVRTKFNRLIQVNGQVVGINQRTAKEWVFSKSANQLKNIDKQAFIDKSNAFNNADELLKASKNYIGEEQKHSRKDNISEFARGTVTFQVENRMYIADIIVGTTSKGSAVLYDIVNIQSKKTVASPSHTAQSRRSDVSATNNSIRQNSEKSIDDVKNAAQNEILSKKQTAALRDRGVAGDDFLNAEDLAKEILSVGGTITEDGKVVLYHGTTAEAAAKIKESGKMVGKEPNLFFSTKKDGLILDYGKSVVEVQIPLEKLELNDIFDDELHLTTSISTRRIPARFHSKKSGARMYSWQKPQLQ